jgi:hypothetical protein
MPAAAARATRPIFPETPRDPAKIVQLFPGPDAAVIVRRNRTGLETTLEGAQAESIRAAYAAALRKVRGTGIGEHSYLRRRWLPILGPVAIALIEALRRHTYVDRARGELRDTWRMPIHELAAAIGRSESTVKRLLNLPMLRLFVLRARQRRYSPAHQASVVCANLYLVAVTDPLIPEDRAEVERLVLEMLRQQREADSRPKATLARTSTPQRDLHNAGSKRPPEQWVKMTPQSSSSAAYGQNLEEGETDRSVLREAETIGNADAAAADVDTSGERDRRGAEQSAPSAPEEGVGQKQAASSASIRGPAWEGARCRLEHRLIDNCHDSVDRAQQATLGILGKAMRAGCPPEAMEQLIEHAWARVYGRVGVANKAAYLIKVLSEDVLTVARMLNWDAARVAAKYTEQQNRRRKREEQRR